jgi:hypothetical protein
MKSTNLIFLICIVGVESKLHPLGTSAIYWPIVPAPGDCEDGEFGGMNGRGNRSTQRKPAPAPICPTQIPLDQTRDWTRAAVVGSQRLTASAMARPFVKSTIFWDVMLYSLVDYKHSSKMLPISTTLHGVTSQRQHSSQSPPWETQSHKLIMYLCMLKE